METFISFGITFFEITVRDEMERKWTLDYLETINLRHKFYYPTESNINRVRFELGFQAFVRRGGGESGFSFFPQLEILLQP